MSANASAISIRDVTKRYVGRSGETIALDRISLEIRRGEIVAMVGPSGCGKSTLLNMIAGIIPLTSGTIRQDDTAITQINRNVGYCTQVDSVLPWMTVQQNVRLPLDYRGVARDQSEKRVEEMLRLVGLLDFLKAYPRELSGGMRKRVALAQMLAYDPEILLMDEPFGALDSQLKLVMQAQLLRIWQERKKTIIFVTHDLQEAITVASRVVVFSGRPGSIKYIEDIDIPTPRDVFKVRFLPEFERLYSRLWAQVAPEIERGEAL